MILHKTLLPPRPAPRRGIATMLAIILLMVMAGTITAMTLVFAAQTHRTQAAIAGSQLRQLLAAAVPCAQQELATHAPPASELPITTPVPESTLILHFTTPADAEARVRVTATLGTFKAIETLTFTRPANPAQPWPLQSAILVQSP